MIRRQRKLFAARRRERESSFSWDEYYKRNRDRISRRRKERYQKDARYRKAILEQNKEYYDRERKHPPVDRTVIKHSKGTFFSISQMAEAIKRKPITVRQYHSTGMFPPPTHSDTRGWRLYTPEQVSLAKSLFIQYDAKKIDKEQLIEELKKGWNDGEEVHG